MASRSKRELVGVVVLAGLGGVDVASGSGESERKGRTLI